jgi:type I restriction enzyme M protein
MAPSPQEFLKELDKKLWNAADRLRANLDAAVYRHAVLGLISKRSGQWTGATWTAEGCPKGWRGGANQYYTPKSIVSCIVEMLEPYQGRVYDPAMGSGGFSVQSERFIAEHGGKLGNLSVYGQESNPTTWRLAAMNMAIRGIDFTAKRGSAFNQREAIPQSLSAAKDHFGKEPANSFISDQHPDLRADYVMANPPFNMSEWWDAKLEGEPRWRYGTLPRRRRGIAGVGRRGNANFAWIQHMLHHLAPQGSMALLLANGSMSSGSGREGQIRQARIKADLAECMN